MPSPHSPELAIEETKIYLEFEREPWLTLKGRVARSAGLDGELNQDFYRSNKRMNYLLEDLFRLVATEFVVYDFTPENGLTKEYYEQFRKAA